jgi:diamine N-acetyltransferase
MSQSITLRGQHVVLRPLQAGDAEITFAWRQGARARLLNVGAQSVEEQVAWINAKSKHAETARFLIGDEAAVRGVPAAVEAMKLLYEFAFDQLGLQRLFGNVTADNMLMVKWQKYLGMKEEGRMRRHHFINGTFQDAIILGLLVEEYREVSLPKMNQLIKLAAASAGESGEGR